LSQAAARRNAAKFHVRVWQFLSLQSSLAAHQMLDIHINNDRSQAKNRRLLKSISQQPGQEEIPGRAPSRKV
jgi:hypothetical protein